MQPRLCCTKICQSPYTHLAVQIFDRTGQKFDLDFSVQIFERLAVQIFLRLALFRVNGTPNRTYFRAVPFAFNVA